MITQTNSLVYKAVRVIQDRP